MTFFLSVPPDRYVDAIVNLKAAGLLNDPERTRVVENLGTDIQSANHLQSVVAGCLREKQVYPLIIILAKIVLITYLLLGLVILWNPLE